jgi:hypothetical protein
MIVSKEKWQRVEAYPDRAYSHQHTHTNFKLNALFRLKVPGGWLTAMCEALTGCVSGTSFYPDPEHKWLLPEVCDYDDDGH